MGIPELTVTSADGTPIACWRTGAGPPLLLVHGVIADHSTTWRLVRGQLEQHFTVYAMDRRGRGASGDAAIHSLEREAEDVAAVVKAIGAAVHVLGHSYGALCALEASTLTHNMRSLILYEGVPVRGADHYPAGLIDRLAALEADGKNEEMLVTMFRELVRMPDEEIELLRSQHDAWRVRLTNARVMPRELRAEHGYEFDATRFTKLAARVLFLVGADSPAHELDNATSIAAQLPAAQVRVLPGQQHLAMFTAPDVFVREVSTFLHM